MTVTTDPDAATDAPDEGLPPPQYAAPPHLLRQLAGRYAGPAPHDIAGQRAWAHELAKAKHAIPTHYYNSPGDIMALIGHAISLDIPLAVALRHLHFEDGRGGMDGHLMHGLIIRAGHRIQVMHHDNAIVRMRLIRCDGQPTIEARWRIVEAARARLLNKDNWSKYPEDMLYWRCVSRLARRGAPDVVLGFGHVFAHGELEAGDPDEYETLPDEPVDLSALDDQRNAEVHPEVITLLADVDTLEWAEVRKRMAQANTDGLLYEPAGSVGGIPLTVFDVLFNAGEEARTREQATDDTGTPPAPTTEPPDPTDDDTAVVDGGDERRQCGCLVAAYLMAGDHVDPGCKIVKAREKWAQNGGEKR